MPISWSRSIYTTFMCLRSLTASPEGAGIHVGQELCVFSQIASGNLCHISFYRSTFWRSDMLSKFEGRWRIESPSRRLQIELQIAMAFEQGLQTWSQNCRTGDF